MGVERYRIHESEEMKKRNKVTPGEVVRAVILQQVIQVTLAVFWLTEDDVLHRESPEVAMTRLAPSVLAIARVLLGDITAARFMRAYGGQILYCVYWWIIPTVQFFFSWCVRRCCSRWVSRPHPYRVFGHFLSFVIDTWQYFLHRAMHVNKFLYRQFHSWHHRLYVPYAYGALYNHPVEGFILDSLGAVIAEALAGLSIRQSSLLFGFSAAKTVDDHCGFALPWDPLQFLYPNNARYHDIHHQHYGLKYNFSQPFWVHWDVIMGTRWDKPARPLAAEKRAALAEKNGPDSDVSSDSGIAMGSVNKED